MSDLIFHLPSGDLCFGQWLSYIDVVDALVTSDGQEASWGISVVGQPNTHDFVASGATTGDFAPGLLPNPVLPAGAAADGGTSFGLEIPGVFVRGTVERAILVPEPGSFLLVGSGLTLPGLRREQG